MKIQIGLNAWNCAGAQSHRCQPKMSKLQIDVAQREQIQRCRHLLVEDEEEDRLHGQHQGGDKAGALIAMAVVDQVGEYPQHDEAGGIDENRGHPSCCSTKAPKRTRPRTPTASTAEQLVDLHRLLVRRRADMVQGVTHQQVIAQTHQQADAAHAKCRMPAQFAGVVLVHVILDPRRQRASRTCRADVHRHVVDGEGAVDLGIITLVDLAHQVAGIRFEQAVADHDHAQRTEQEPHALAGHGHERIADSKDDGAKQHGAAGTEYLVADPSADRRCGVDQRRTPHPR